MFGWKCIGLRGEDFASFKIGLPCHSLLISRSYAFLTWTLGIFGFWPQRNETTAWSCPDHRSWISLMIYVLYFVRLSLLLFVKQRKKIQFTIVSQKSLRSLDPCHQWVFGPADPKALTAVLAGLFAATWFEAFASVVFLLFFCEGLTLDHNWPCD